MFDLDFKIWSQEELESVANKDIVELLNLH